MLKKRSGVIIDCIVFSPAFSQFLLLLSCFFLSSRLSVRLPQPEISCQINSAKSLPPILHHLFMYILLRGDKMFKNWHYELGFVNDLIFHQIKMKVTTNLRSNETKDVSI